MTPREAITYLRSMLPNDPQAIEALGVLEMLADTADELAALHVEETAGAESK